MNKEQIKREKDIILKSDAVRYISIAIMIILPLLSVYHLVWGKFYIGVIIGVIAILDHSYKVLK